MNTAEALPYAPRSRVDRKQWRRKWKRLNPRQKAEYVRSLSASEYLEFEKTWEFEARDAQLWPDGPWDTWYCNGGRGWGKTRVGAQAVREAVESGKYGVFGFVGYEAEDVRKVMVEGRAGILAVSHPDFMPKYEASKHLLTWPNGAVGHTYSVYNKKDADKLRGPEHDFVWSDEVGKWGNHQEYAYDMINMGLRVGPHPRHLITTTPRFSKLIKEFFEKSKDPGSGVVMTGGHSRENIDNLSPRFVKTVIERYEGTRIGRQELGGELLEDVPGALWTPSMIEPYRVDKYPDLHRIVVAVDPNVSASDEADVCGIVIAGSGPSPDGLQDGHAYVLDDMSGEFGPLVWARKVCAAYSLQQADCVVAEVNNGGDLVEINIRTVDPNVTYRSVHASRGKRTRAEPVASIYEQGKIHHVGPLPELEDELTTHDFTTGLPSPGRLDAVVWAITELLIDEAGDLIYW